MRLLLKNKLLRKILLFFLAILSIVNKFVKKSPNRILFYDAMGNTFYDNTRALFEHMRENGCQEKYTLICCIPNGKSYKYLEEENIKVVGVFQGLFYYLTSKYVFFSYSSMRIRPSKKQMVINQWHGTPLKSLGIPKNDKVASKESMNYFTYTLAASKPFIPIMANAFNSTTNEIAVLGHTRNDLLFSTKDVFKKVNIKKADYKKVILWMPTFRVSKDNRYTDISKDEKLSETALPLLEDYKDLESFNKYLIDHEVLIIMKVHTYAKFRDFDYSNISLYTSENLDEKGIQLYEFIKEFDALLTDYSSVFFDYLLLDRPIGFTIDDYKSYERNRGFSLNNALNYMPGHHIETIEGLYSFIADVINGKDEYIDKRKEINQFANKYTDGENCKRLLEFCGIE